MAWDTTLVTMVRNLINDTDPDNQTYTDARIKEGVVVAGLIVSQEYPFPTNYTFDLDQVTISPDPISDPVAIGLIALKTACMFNLNSYQNAVGAGIEVQDGDSRVSTIGSFKGWDSIIREGPCASYQKLLKTRLQWASMHRGKAVLGPLTAYDFILVSPGGYTLSNFFNALVLR